MIFPAVALAVGLLVPVIDPFTPGDQYETFILPPIDCSVAIACHSLWYTIKHNWPTCISYDEIWIRRPDGSDVAFTKEETGRPGEDGYQLDVLTTEVVTGPVVFHVHVSDKCPKISALTSTIGTGK